MSKELKALKRIEYFMSKNAVHWKQDIAMIKTALEEKEQQDSVLKTLKEVIAFAEKLPDIEIDDDGNIQGIIGAVGMNIQRQMKNKERELLRKWILKTCFPKELKALDIIKEKMVNVKDFIFYQNLNGTLTEKEINDLCCGCGKKPLTQEEFNLLKEILK